MSGGGRRLSDLERQAARHLHIRRGPAGDRPIAARAWRCEGRWQADEQMDIWQCCDEVERDRLRAAGELDDDSNNTDNQEEI